MLFCDVLKLSQPSVKLLRDILVSWPKFVCVFFKCHLFILAIFSQVGTETRIALLFDTSVAEAYLSTIHWNPVRHVPSHFHLDKVCTITNWGKPILGFIGIQIWLFRDLTDDITIKRKPVKDF